MKRRPLLIEARLKRVADGLAQIRSEAALSASGAGEQPALIAYMTATTREARSAAFLRTYAERVRNNTAVTWEIPNTVASTLEDIATLLDQSASGAGIDPSQPIIQELRKLPRYWMHIPNAAASSTQVVCWVDVQRVIDQSAGVDRQAPPPWQLIETAPKHRMDRLLLAFPNRQVVTGYWENRYRGWKTDPIVTTSDDPTHWMPLPDPPSAGVGGAPPPARVLINRLENYYDFECAGGPLKNCVEWQQLISMLKAQT